MSMSAGLPSRLRAAVAAATVDTCCCCAARLASIPQCRACTIAVVCLAAGAVHSSHRLRPRCVLCRAQVGGHALAFVKLQGGKIAKIVDPNELKAIPPPPTPPPPPPPPGGAGAGGGLRLPSRSHTFAFSHSYSCSPAIFSFTSCSCSLDLSLHPRSLSRSSSLTGSSGF
jgi:hypothetical protein